MSDTLLSQFQRARATNSTDSSFPSRPATATKPSSDGVIEPRRFGEFASGTLVLVPFGAGSDNTTFDLRVISWRPTSGSSLWVPTVVAQASCTLSASVGVAGHDVLNTERFADTLSVALGTSGVDVQAFSPANDTPGHLLIDVKGAALIEVLFDMTGATSGNALYAFL